MMPRTQSKEKTDMFTTILALLMATPTASADDDFRRKACEKLKGTWNESGFCEYWSVSSELKHVQIESLEDIGLVQIAIRGAEEEEWAVSYTHLTLPTKWWG